MMRATALLVIAATAGWSGLACSLQKPDVGGQGYGSSALAITNAEGELGLLRTGTALNLRTSVGKNLEPQSMYRVEVTNERTGSLIAQTDVLTDENGALERTPIAHDLGEFDDVKDDDTLHLALIDATQHLVGEEDISVTPHETEEAGHGFQVDEVQPAHVFSSDQNGTAINGFVVGALPAAGETAAPIYVAGEGFPTGLSKVDIYIVKDRDAWQQVKIPLTPAEGFVAGPVTASLEAGKLAPTAISSWVPTGKDIGPYDILVDTNGNGIYDYKFSEKDASDGEDKVGLTIQYSANWLRAKTASEAATTAATAAQQAADAANTAATGAEQGALGAGHDAATQARTAATNAQNEATAAGSAAQLARQAFDQTLADVTTTESQAALADAASKRAMAFADEAAKAANAAAQLSAVQKAANVADAAQITASHLLINLAYSSAERDGTWANTYNQDQPVYTYMNPPVQSTTGHAAVAKLLIPHQSWSQFWNNPNKLEPGGPGIRRIAISNMVVGAPQVGTLQPSCTNTPPIRIINPRTLPVNTGATLKYDIVFDYGNDGYYDVGKDLLDVVSQPDDGNLVSPATIGSLPEDQIYGFQITQ